MKTERWEHHSIGIQIEIDPFNDSETFRPRISVRKRKNFEGDDWQDANVNWSAIGSVEPDRAREFGEALIAAAKMAHELDRETIFLW